MNEQKEVEQKRERRSRAGSDRTRRYTEAEKLRAVKLHLEEGFKVALVCQETGVSMTNLYLWLRRYRKDGEAGLQGQPAPRPGAGCPVRWWRRLWS